ncbi:MAG: DUF4391 family protein [Clostridia bacterium]|nr:DUF4391 family protein [Clostridia bacterium]
MFGIDQKYSINKKIPIKDFIPKDSKPQDKRKIKEIIKKVVLSWQLTGEELPSVVDEIYNYQIIQIFDFEVTEIKKAGYISTMYQEIIKAPCILRIHDSSHEVYSFALKRLNKNDSTQVVVTDFLLTDPFSIDLPDVTRDTLMKAITYSAVRNKQNKVTYYLEIFVKAYLLKNSKLYSKLESFLEKPIWYDESKVLHLYQLVKELASQKEKLIKSVTTAEKMKINQLISQSIKEIDTI